MRACSSSGSKALRRSKPQINGLFQRLAALGEMCQGRQRLLKIRHGLTVRRARHCSAPGLPAVGQRLVPHLAPHGMVRQPFDLLGQAVRVEPFEGLDNAPMQRPPPLLEQTAVGHLVGQGVFEGEFALGEQPRLIEELGRLQVGQATVQVRLGQLGNGLQQGQGHLGANDRGGLEQVFLLRRQPVDARRQYRLHRGRHLQAGQGLRQPIGTRRADEHPRLHQGAHALLQKERITPGACDQQLSVEGRQAGRRPPAAPAGIRPHSRGAAGRAGAGGSTSCCPSHAGTPAGS